MALIFTTRAMEQPSDRVLHERYCIQSLLGRQTGRRTFLAEDVQTRSAVVIKLLLFGPDFTWDDLKLFEREAETLKVLDRPSVPRYLDFFEIETELGKGFALVQNYIEARSLQDWIQSGRNFSEAELKTIARELLEILTDLHDRKPPIIHRDIKPSNILLGDRTGKSLGKVYLIDFGSVQTAAHGGTMTVVGTYGYMPPEQFGGRATPLSDLYSLGATIIYLATGQHPAELMTDDLRLEFQQFAQLSPQFAHWLSRMVQSAPSQRFEGAKVALEALNDERWEGNLTPINSASLSRVSEDRPSLFSRPLSALCTVEKDALEIKIFSPSFASRSKLMTLTSLILLAFIACGLPSLYALFVFSLVLMFSLTFTWLWPPSLPLKQKIKFVEKSFNHYRYKTVLAINEIEIFQVMQFDDEDPICMQKAPRSLIKKIQLFCEFDSFYNVRVVTTSAEAGKFLIGAGKFRLSKEEAEWLANELSVWLNIPVTDNSVAGR